MKGKKSKYLSSKEKENILQGNILHSMVKFYTEGPAFV